MGVFGEFFGFDGRLDRLGYLWRSVVAALGVAVLAAIGAVILFVAVRPRSEADFETCLGGVLGLGTLLSLWAGFALSTRRLRGIGVEPLYVVPFYVALWVVHAVLLQPLAVLHPEAFGLIEGGWLVVECLCALPLLFWPSRGRAEAAPADYAHPEPTSYLNWRESP